MMHIRFFLAWILLAGTSSPAALGETSTAPSASASSQMDPELAKTLRDASWRRKQALKERFDPVLQDLARRSSGDYRTLYLDAVYGAFFSNEPKPEKAFKVWAKKNEGLVEDPRMALATELVAASLEGHIYLIINDEEKATARFVKVLTKIQEGPENLTSFHLLQESLAETLLVKFYGIETDYLKEGHYTGALSNVEEWFTIHILPWHEVHRPDEVGKLWDMVITATGKIASVNELKMQQFNLSECPRLMVAKADSLKKVGRKEEATQTLKIILQKFPEYPKFSEVTQKLIELQ